MRFDWDEQKRLDNLNKHGIDFADLAELFENETATAPDERFNYGEERLLSFGLLLGEVIAVVHTEDTNGDDSLIRVISARKAEKYEQEYYFKNIRD
ncbi:MAG: BrnT family toxin [Acidobacteria bacterium]|nr:BrnT family toxin [Acidobacteriota bacterium]